MRPHCQGKRGSVHRTPSQLDFTKTACFKQAQAEAHAHDRARPGTPPRAMGAAAGGAKAPRRGSVMGAVHKAEDVAVKKVAKSKGFGMMMSMVDSIN